MARAGTTPLRFGPRPLKRPRQPSILWTSLRRGQWRGGEIKGSGAVPENLDSFPEVLEPLFDDSDRCRGGSSPGLQLVLVEIALESSLDDVQR